MRCRVPPVYYQVADVGNPGKRVGADKHRVPVVEERVAEQQQRTRQTEPPERRRHHDLFALLGRIPLDKEAGKEAVLPPDLSRDLYTALLQKLVEAQPVTEVQLNELARERAEAIKQEFVAAGPIDEGRLTVLEPSATEEKGEETVSSVLTLDVRP